MTSRLASFSLATALLPWPPFTAAVAEQQRWESRRQAIAIEFSWELADCIRAEAKRRAVEGFEGVEWWEDQLLARHRRNLNLAAELGHQVELPMGLSLAEADALLRRVK